MAGTVAGLGVAAFLLLGPLADTSTAAGSGHTDGACTGETGVTVVVDASALHGGTAVECVPDAKGMNGLEALEAAGFTVTGTRRYGDAFVCRIDGRPSPTHDLAIPGDEDYRETCASTPPTSAMWAYFSGDDGQWAYNRTGAKSHTVEPGGFEGWSFTIDAAEGSEPPGVAPEHGGSRTGTATSPAASPEANTEASTAGEQQAASGDTDAGSSGSGSAAPWVAGAAVVGLGALAASATRRRRRAHEDGP